MSAPFKTGLPGPQTYLPSPSAMKRRRRRRYLADSAAAWLVRAGGGGVVAALALIFVYLFSEVVPMLRGASVEQSNAFVAPAATDSETVLLALERYDTLGMRHSSDGRLSYFRLEDGQLLEELQLEVPEGVRVESMAIGEPRSRRVAYGLSDGTAIVVDHEIELEFTDGERSVVPAPVFPLGKEPVTVDDQASALRSLAVQKNRKGETGLAAVTADGRLMFVHFRETTSFLSGETEFERRAWTLPKAPGYLGELQLTSNLWSLIGVDDAGMLQYWDISDPGAAVLRDQVSAVEAGERVTELKMLNGTFSMVVGTSEGRLSQWFLVRDQRADAGDNIFGLERVRDFDRHPGAITRIQPEYTRKGFAVVDEAGGLGLHYGTSARTLFLEQVSDTPLRAVGISPVDDQLVVEDEAGTITRFDVWNEHPEVSLKALWGKVWYEGREDPEYVWQASSGADSFEPKYSMVPLTIGTLKAAFFAMLFAMPLAIAGAIYTAYFMAPKLRGYVKPTIEVMEALPTVILGFLAGLWLAPFPGKPHSGGIHHSGRAAAVVSGHRLGFQPAAAIGSPGRARGLGSGHPAAGDLAGGLGAGVAFAADRNLVL